MAREGQQGRLAEGWRALDNDELRAAEDIARGGLLSNPGDPELLYLLGSSLLFQERYPEALAPLKEVLERSPRRGAGHRLGYCLLALGEPSAAEQALRQEVLDHPDLVDAHNALGVALIQQARPQEALAAFMEAARRDPASVTANNNIANVLGDLGRHEEALDYLRRVVQAEPGHAEAHHNLGMLYQSLKRHEEAAASLAEALRLAPRMTYTLSYLVWNKLSNCQWRGVAADIDALRRQVRAGESAADPFTLIAVSSSPEEQLACAVRHARQKMPRAAAPSWDRRRTAREKIRIAYLSADFREHATAHLAARLFELHDRTRFEVIGVSYGADDGSPMRARLERGFDRWIDAAQRSDEETARALHEAQIDIAIDLKGYTTGARPGILAHRPAPIQVSFLGFPGTMGVDFIDYILADRFVLPEEQRRFYAEKVVYLPDCYQVNDDRRPIGSRVLSRAQAGLPDDAFVFCCFNNSYKIMPDVFDIWMRLLNETPHGVLWLLEDNASARHNLAAEAEARGISAGRLVFAPRVPAAEHLARHRLADLFLDTLPYNAHTTASDALWAGLPVLTCTDHTFASRVAGSLLTSLGLSELVTASLGDYEARARDLSRAPGALAALRAKVARGRTGVLYDTDRFRRHIEAAYGAMWLGWQRGDAPRSFAVAAGGAILPG